MVNFIPHVANIYPNTNIDKVFMAIVTIQKIEEKTSKLQVSWQDSPAIKNLLDVIAEIIAIEYVQIAKQNPETFKVIDSPAYGEAHNDIEHKRGAL